MLPEELVSITEKDLCKCRQKVSHCRYRFSLLTSNTFPLQVQTLGPNRFSSVTISATTVLGWIVAEPLPMTLRAELPWSWEPCQVSRMVGFTPRANVLRVSSQPRRFVEQNDKGTEGFGLLAPSLEFSRKVLGSRERFDMPPPPSPHFWPKGIFQRRGVGVYIWRPCAAGILYAPPFYTPPTPRRVFSGVGGGGGV